jgi:hypothetical protein
VDIQEKRRIKRIFTAEKPNIAGTTNTGVFLFSPETGLIQQGRRGKKFNQIPADTGNLGNRPAGSQHLARRTESGKQTPGKDATQSGQSN